MKKLAAYLTLAILIAFSGALLLLALASRPLGPSLALQTTPAAKSPGKTPAAASQNCGESGSMALMVLGLSSPLDRPRRGSDAIRLVQLDFDAPAVRMLSLPPDLWIPTQGMGGSGVVSSTLTMIYWQAKVESQASGFQARETAGTQGLAQALYDRYKYLPDHYITISQTVFTDMVDELGGIQVDVPEDILNVPPGWSTFHAGQQTLDGKQTLDYVRLLNPTGKAYPSEWDRFGRQNLVLHALLAAVLEPANWSKVPALIQTFHQAVVTDLSPAQLLDLACMLQQVGGQAQLLEPTLDMVHLDGTGRMHPIPAEFRKLFDRLENGSKKP